MSKPNLSIPTLALPLLFFMLSACWSVDDDAVANFEEVALCGSQADTTQVFSRFQLISNGSVLENGIRKYGGGFTVEDVCTYENLAFTYIANTVAASDLQVKMYGSIQWNFDFRNNVAFPDPQSANPVQSTWKSVDVIAIPVENDDEAAWCSVEFFIEFETTGSELADNQFLMDQFDSVHVTVRYAAFEE